MRTELQRSTSPPPPPHSRSSHPAALHRAVPSGSWAAAGPPWRAYASAPAPGACCTPAGWWARSGAGVGSAHSASSGWCWDGGTPAPAWTRADAAAWRAPGPSGSAFCLTPNRTGKGIISFLENANLKVQDDISLCSQGHFFQAIWGQSRVSTPYQKNATGNFSFLISLFSFLF